MDFVVRLPTTDSAHPPKSEPNSRTVSNPWPKKGVSLGTISSQQIFSTLNKWHGLNTALSRILQSNVPTTSKTSVSAKASSSVIWGRAVCALSARINANEIDGVLGSGVKGRNVTVEEASHFREAVAALRLAKEVIRMQQGWRANALSI